MGLEELTAFFGKERIQTSVSVRRPDERRLGECAWHRDALGAPIPNIVVSFSVFWILRVTVGIWGVLLSRDVVNSRINGRASDDAFDVVAVCDRLGHEL